MKKFLGVFMLVSFLLVSCVSSADSAKSAAAEKGKKLVALTFDDGPDVKLTPRVLEKLDKYGVRATFFMVGQLVNEDTAPVVRRIVDMGCEIGNHSWAWDSMDKMSEDEIRKSVEDTSARIREYAGVTPAFFRPPNLAVSNTMYDVIGMPFASGVLAFDWAGQNTSAEDRANNVLKAVRDGAIILMHDVQPEPHPTPEALDIIIPKLMSEGYEFVTLSELFERKGIDPMSKEYDMWVYVE